MASSAQLLELTRNGQQKSPAYTTTEKETFFNELRYYAQSRGFKDGWAYWKYKDKFGVGPANTFQKRIASPSPATLSWIKHRNIAKAKQRDKHEQRKAG